MRFKLEEAYSEISLYSSELEEQIETLRAKKPDITSKQTSPDKQ